MLSVPLCFCLCFVSPHPTHTHTLIHSSPTTPSLLVSKPNAHPTGCLHLRILEVRREQSYHAKSVRESPRRGKEGREGSVEGERKPPLQPDCRYMANPSSPPPPHEGYWQQLNILVEVLNRREREKREVGGWRMERDRERRQGRGRRGGTGGSNCWILHFKSQAVRENTFYTRLLLVLFFLKAMNYASSWEHFPSVLVLRFRVQAWWRVAPMLPFYHDLENAGCKRQ